MAILRLARFNLESDLDESAHLEFRGLPSPAAAGTVCATMLMYLSLKNPEIETSDGTSSGTVQLNAPTVYNNGQNTGIWVRHH